jgi:hypothetical protein
MDIELDAANGKRLGYLLVREGKSKNARRHVSLTSRSRDARESIAREQVGICLLELWRQSLSSNFASQEAKGRFGASKGLRDTLVSSHVFDEVR